ncbi:crossover junction endodeoxyribonuclease RuvC [Candidatus Woesebacteria bacterium]|nr:crossover junction endodeoxyribonuclease RuvC [Candidatus Woesebacteria bacterium]
MGNTTHTTITERTVIGIDPGFDRLGWAVGRVEAGQKITTLGFGCITTDKKLALLERYAVLQEELEKILLMYQPTDAAIESLFFANNQKTVMQVSEARGIIIANLLRQKIQIGQYTPLQIKQAVTGFGRADKIAVEKMVRLQLKITESHILDDTMDALAILITHSTQLPIQRLL